MKKIKSITTFAVTEFSPPEGLLAKREERNEKGLVILEEEFQPDGSLESRVVRTFDGEDRIELEREFSSDSEQPDQETKFRYSAGGRLEGSEIHYQDGSVTFRKHEFDEANKSETINIVDEDGEVEGKEYRRFDSEDRVLEEVIHGEDEQLEQSVVREYDEHGMMLKRITLFQDDYKTTELFYYERDEKGLISERVIEDEEGNTLRVDEFTYDDKGNTTEHRAQDYNQGWAIVDRWELNEKELIIKSQRLKPDGSVMQEVVLDYDEDDLLVRQENLGDRGSNVLLYQYEYHD